MLDAPIYKNNKNVVFVKQKFLKNLKKQDLVSMRSQKAHTTL